MRHQRSSCVISHLRSSEGYQRVMRGSPEEMNTPVRPTETPRPGAAVHATANRLCFAVGGPTPRAQLRVLFGCRYNGPL